jgi:hypothetical protein
MASLIGTSVAANYQKFRPTTQMGTRALRFVTVTFNNGSDSDIDLTAAYASGTGTFAGSYTDANSYFARAVRTAETFFEVWAVGTPTATTFTLIVADDTAQDNIAVGQPVATEVTSGTYADAEAAIFAAIGIGAKAGLATAYNGTVVLASVSLSGVTLA